MSSALAVAPTSRSGLLSEIDIALIHESPTNPRKRFGDLEELAASIRAQGIIEPLIVRESRGGGYELVAGARRLRAASKAGLVDVPCLVRTLTDLQVLELQISENISRKDVHPLEEADGYAALMQADHAYTPEAVGARVGRSTSYVYQRLKLLELVPDARKAFEQDELTAAHAIKLARLSKEDQKRALPECFLPLFHGEKGEKRDPQPVAHLDRWIEDHTKVDVKDRESLQHYLPEFSQQLEAEPVASLLALSESPMPGFYLRDKDHGLIGAQSWKEVKSEKACSNTKRGAIVHGGAHRVLWVCAKKGCPKHWPIEKKAAAKKGAAKKTKPQFDWKAQEEQRRKDAALWDKVAPLAYVALAKMVVGTKLDDRIWNRIVDAIAGYDLDVKRDVAPAFKAAGLSVTIEHLPALVAFSELTDSLWGVGSLRELVKKRKLAIDVDALVAQVQPPAEAPKTAKAKKGGRK